MSAERIALWELCNRAKVFRDTPIVDDAFPHVRNRFDQYLKICQNFLEQPGADWEERFNKLFLAVNEHHDQKADDRCIEDDDKLYAAAGLPPCDRRVGDKAATRPR